MPNPTAGGTIDAAMDDYRVTCECGRAVPVSERAAGSRVTCPCGREVEVPSLRELRRLAGAADTVNPVLVLERLAASGRLVASGACSRCGRDDAATVHITVTCERSWTKTSRLAWWLMPALPWFARILVREEAEEAPAQQFGRDVSLRLPLRLCAACRPEVRDRAALCDVLREVPEFAALLDRYPAARLSLPAD